ncbi:TRAP transporter small permease [Oceanobacter mangrovi]|uniref:TRAP transporter small permease n=1 Tax=Oceanobacter mangrovi TaxID=2862510 RepID=UPI001C8E64A9|nr:TRAP transporter small permease [Oceanobacter mangrovi]
MSGCLPVNNLRAASPQTSAAGVWLQQAERCSGWLARWELRAAGLAMALVLGLLLLNIVTRAIGQALFWVDEAAITAMVWMAFLASAASLHHRSNIAMTLLVDHLPIRLARLAQLLSDIVMLLFVMTLSWMIWRWFDPLTLIRLDGDGSALAQQTFNFIYEEPTQTLGIHKFWCWLILPLFSVGALIHLTVRLFASTCELMMPATHNHDRS